MLQRRELSTLSHEERLAIWSDEPPTARNALVSSLAESSDGELSADWCGLNDRVFSVRDSIVGWCRGEEERVYGGQ